MVICLELGADYLPILLSISGVLLFRFSVSTV